MDDLSRQRALAEATVSRRTDLGMTQAELAAAGDISLATVQAIEAARGGVNMRQRTVTGLERALRWKSGSVHRILDGGKPEAVSSIESVGTLFRLLRAGGGNPEPLIWRLNDAEKADPGSTARALHRLSTDVAGSSAEVRAIVEQELSWEPGSVSKMLDTPLPPEPQMDERIHALMELQHQESSAKFRALRQLPNSLPSPVADAIAQSGLPYPLQNVITEGMEARQVELRRQMRTQIQAETETMLRATQQALQAALEMTSCSFDEHQAQDVVEAVIRRTLKGLGGYGSAR